VKCPFLSAKVPPIGIIPNHKSPHKIFHLYILHGIITAWIQKESPWLGIPGAKTAVRLMAVTAFLWTEPKRIWLT